MHCTDLPRTVFSRIKRHLADEKAEPPFFRDTLYTLAAGCKVIEVLKVICVADNQFLFV